MFIALLGQIVQSGGFVLDIGSGEVISSPTNEAQADAFPPPQELLQNTGFESGDLAPWYQAPGNHWVITTLFPHSGTYCATDTGNYWIRQDFVQPVLTDSIVSITFWSRQPDNQIQAFDFMYSDMTYHEDIVWPTSVWQQFDITSWLSDQMGKTMVGLRFWGYVGGGPAPDSTYTDDLSIIAKVPLELKEGSNLPIATLSAWPSTFSHTCRVDLHAPSEGRLCLYSSSGALVKELWHGTGKGTVYLGPELPPGVYILTLRYGTSLLQRTVIRR
jgi:hypothetical protein